MPSRVNMATRIVGGAVLCLFFACGGTETDPGDLATFEQGVVEKNIMLAGPGHRVWGLDDWDCRSGYEAAGCPSPTHPGCTVGDVDSGNCVCPWPDYCMPFFD